MAKKKLEEPAAEVQPQVVQPEIKPKSQVKFEAGDTVKKYNLSEEEIEDVVAFYLGIHPRFVFWGGYDCRVLIHEVVRAGYNFNGFLPCLKRTGAL